MNIYTLKSLAEHMIHYWFEPYYDRTNSTVFGVTLTQRGCMLMAYPARTTINDFVALSRKRNWPSCYTFEEYAKRLFIYKIMCDWRRRKWQGDTIEDFLGNLPYFGELAKLYISVNVFRVKGYSLRPGLAKFFDSPKPRNLNKTPNEYIYLKKTN